MLKLEGKIIGAKYCKNKNEEIIIFNATKKKPPRRPLSLAGPQKKIQLDNISLTSFKSRYRSIFNYSSANERNELTFSRSISPYSSLQCQDLFRKRGSFLLVKELSTDNIWLCEILEIFIHSHLNQQTKWLKVKLLLPQLNLGNNISTLKYSNITYFPILPDKFEYSFHLHITRR
jgi:hypothetical protein